jgi:hypothetical protein
MRRASGTRAISNGVRKKMVPGSFGDDDEGDGEEEGWTKKALEKA